MTANLAEYRAHRELLTHLTLRELRSKYKRSFFGWAWSLATPLVNMVVYSIVFSYFFHAAVLPGEPSGLHIYALFLMCGMLPFNFMQGAVMGCIATLIGNGNLIKKTYFPRELLPASTVFSNLVSHFIEMGLLLVALLAFGNWRALVYLPITIVLILLTTIFAPRAWTGPQRAQRVLPGHSVFHDHLLRGLVFHDPSRLLVGHPDPCEQRGKGSSEAQPHDRRGAVVPGDSLRWHSSGLAGVQLLCDLRDRLVLRRSGDLQPVRRPLGRGAVTGGVTAVEAVGVSKKFRLIHERNASLKATILRGRRTVAEDFWALRDVSIAIKAGQCFGLIGENGSGKSTMLKCLTGILRPEEGRVRVEGKISALLELGAGFHPELSGRENVFLNGAILGLSQKELRRRFDEIVEFAGIETFIDEPVKNYSSGMYVRLGFSVAINVDPDVLFVDEVLAVGDEAFQRKCNEKFADLRQQGKTIVLVSHGLSSVQNLCDEVAWFSHGRLMQQGDPRSVIEAYTDTVLTDRQVDEEGHGRWGSGEGRITHVELIGADGEATSHVKSGDRAILRLHYEMSAAIERPVFAIAIDTIEGFRITGPSSRDVDCVPEKLEGSGYIDVTFESLRLLPGSYDLSVSLSNYSRTHQFDARERLLRFDVDRGSIKEQVGVVSLGGDWKISKA